MTRWIPTVLLILVIAYLFLDSAEYDPYCDMVSIWEETNGNFGWPPFRGECD